MAGARNRSAERAANAQCPAGWFSSGAYACEKF